MGAGDVGRGAAAGDRAQHLAFGVQQADLGRIIINQAVHAVEDSVKSGVQLEGGVNLAVDFAEQAQGFGRAALLAIEHGQGRFFAHDDDELRRVIDRDAMGGGFDSAGADLELGLPLGGE